MLFIMKMSYNWLKEMFIALMSITCGLWRCVVLWYDTHNPRDLDLKHHRRKNLKTLYFSLVSRV
jgi:hypothetical protein